MKSSLRLAGAAALCAALLVTACAKKTDQTTTTSTDATQSAATNAPDAATAGTATPDASATTAPDAGATTAPDASATGATTAPVTTTITTSNGAASGGYIDLPVYPGATEIKEQAMSVSGSDGSVAMRAYSTKADPKTVADWYKTHLPDAFKNAIFTSGDKTSGTFVNEHKDGDQSVLVTSQSDGTTRIQLTTKHGK
jgi:hypothetical protein